MSELAELDRDDQSGRQTEGCRLPAAAGRVDYRHYPVARFVLGHEGPSDVEPSYV